MPMARLWEKFMTKRMSLTLFLPLSCMFVVRLLAQDQTKLKEPEYVNQFFWLDSTAALKPLEHATPQGKTHLKALGYGGQTDIGQLQERIPR